VTMDAGHHEPLDALLGRYYVRGEENEEREE
jgi:hypothetical protein